MANRKRPAEISDRTLALLGEGESERCDFKRVPEGISGDDLVSFANTEAGGCILVGVDEVANSGGVQTGSVVGCDVSDAAVLQVVNKALACLPPIAIKVHIENVGKLPFLRVDVPSSSTKPHCTPKGVYCRRDGSRNRAIHPSELLKIFLENESRVFAERFESAANRITIDLANLEESLEESIQSMGDQLGWADSKLGETSGTLDSILAYSQRINTEISDLKERLRALFRQDKRQDPIHDRERKKLTDEIVNQLLKDKNLRAGIRTGKSISISANGKAAEELTQDDLRQIFQEAVRVVEDRLEREKYSIEVKKPLDCAEGEVRDFAKLVEEGGEVAHGVERRLKTAISLGLVRYEKELIGTAAVKSPIPRYRDSVFRKAKAAVEPGDFALELGWIFLARDHRSKGQMRPLIETLLKANQGFGIFATTRVSNEKMQRILTHQGFVRHGDHYASDQNTDDAIILFIRPVSPA